MEVNQYVICIFNDKQINCTLKNKIGVCCRVRCTDIEYMSSVLIILVLVIKLCKSCYTFEVLH